MTTDHTHDVIIAGGGSAGLSAALQLARLRVDVVVLDGAAPRNRFAAHMHGVLGRDHTSPLDLLADGRAELARYDVDVRQDAAATATRTGNRVDVQTSAGDRLGARALLVATGARDVLPAIPGLAERWGRGVHHCPFCDGWENRDSRIGVLAETAESVHQIGMLRRLTDRLTVLTNGSDVFSPEQRAWLAALGTVDDRAVTAVRADGDADGIRGVEVADGGTLELDALFVRPEPVPADELLVALGADRVAAFGGSWAGVDAMGRTSVPGVWAAGNVVNPMLSVAASIAAGATAGYGLVAELLAG